MHGHLHPWWRFWASLFGQKFHWKQDGVCNGNEVDVVFPRDEYAEWSIAIDGIIVLDYRKDDQTQSVHMDGNHTIFENKTVVVVELEVHNNQQITVHTERELSFVAFLEDQFRKENC